MRVFVNSVLREVDVFFVASGWEVDRGRVVLSMKVSSFSELLDTVEQSRKKILTRVTRFKIKVRLQHFFFLTEIFNWVNIASAWSWTYWLAFHIYILDSHHTCLLGTLCCYTFRFSSSLHIFSVLKLFGSPLLQHHVPADVSLTQALLSLNQLNEWDLLTLSKPMNRRTFLRFLIKFLTKCHSDWVSIETSEPFPWRLYLSLAVLQSMFSSWKEYLEQTVTGFYGKPIDKREERQTRKNFLFTYPWILLYHSRIRKSYTQKENWIKPSDTHESFYICYVAVRIGWKKLNFQD